MFFTWSLRVKITRSESNPFGFCFSFADNNRSSFYTGIWVLRKYKLTPYTFSYTTRCVIRFFMNSFPFLAVIFLTPKVTLAYFRLLYVYPIKYSFPCRISQGNRAIYSLFMTLRADLKRLITSQEKKIPEHYYLVSTALFFARKAFSWGPPKGRRFDSILFFNSDSERKKTERYPHSVLFVVVNLLLVGCCPSVAF